MRKIIKNNILGFILGGLIFGCIGIYAASYAASDISYTRDGKQINVSEALDDLYNMALELENIKSIGDASASEIASGKTVVVKGEPIIGTATVFGTVKGSANLMSGHTDTTVTKPTMTLNVENYTSIEIKVTSTYSSSASLKVSTNNGSINVSLKPGTYTYDLKSATSITFSYQCDISTYSDGKFSYTLIP